MLRSVFSLARPLASASSSTSCRPSISLLPSRSVWSTGQEPQRSTSYLDALTPDEIQIASSAVKQYMSASGVDDPRFVAVSLKEPKPNMTEPPKRQAEVLVLNPSNGIATEMLVQGEEVISSEDLPYGTQPMLTPSDCDLAETISKSSVEVQKALEERYGITDMDKVVGDPWSVHLASEEDRLLVEGDNKPRRLVQTFLYQRMEGDGLECNHYAHPIDILPIVDLNTKSVVRIDGLHRLPAPKIPTASVNYHRNLLHTNSYLETQWRPRMKDLSIVQKDGPTFKVSDNNLVNWQGWSVRVGFNYREGLVLQDIKYRGRPVMNRASLVEMAVPYGDPSAPFTRKCAFDVGDYGLGYCANSLELGCDCLGHIHYFDVAMADEFGNPSVKKKAICMHEEDTGILFKHVEYRNGHNESRRSRELVISSIATVVNYEYLFYWRFKLDGSIEFEIKLSGELSTNLTSPGEDPGNPSHGVLVAPGVNAQTHQHMFCCRLDMSIDGEKNTVSEVDIVAEDSTYGNAFGPVETVLKKEQDAVRVYDSNKARSWKISNAEGKLNAITGKPTAYKLVPFTRGAAGPTVLTHETSSVSKKGAFAQAHLWVTPFDEKERYPAGEYTPQSLEQDGLPKWIKGNRNVEAENIVLWHSFGVTHVPRVEDFPIMNVEHTGFTLKPDGFFTGNPAIDIEPDVNEESKLNTVNCCSS